MRRGAVAVALAAITVAGCAPDPPAAVVGLVIDPCGPGQDIGSGMLVAPGIALTSAHVLAGAHGITVTQNGRSSEGTIVGFDPEMDLAYVSFHAGPGQPLPVASDHVNDGDQGIAYVVRRGDVVEVPVTVTRRVRLRTEDIYIKGETIRPGIEVQAAIQPGDSGAAVVIDGKVVGVIWARSNRFPGRAYAIDAVRAGDRINAQRATGELGDDVDIARCS